MHRSLTTGLALATLTLGLGSAAFGDAKGQPRPSLSDNLGMQIENAPRSGKPRKAGGTVRLEERPSLQDGPVRTRDSAARRAADHELSDDLNVKIDDADAKPKGGDSDLPDWTSCDPFDVNIDGKVDTDDFAELLANFGTAEGDLTGNGLVDGEDLGLLLIRISNLPRN